MNYQNKQIATTLLLAIGIIICSILLVSLDNKENVLWPPVIILGFVAFLFHSLNITINNGDLSWSFGPGFWKKSVKITSINEVSIIKTKWYYGLGIRYLGSGWLYIVSGKSAIQLTLKDGTNVYLGTNDAENLMSLIQSQLPS